MFPAILTLTLAVGDVGPSHIDGPGRGRQDRAIQRGMSVEEVSRALREEPEFIISVRGLNLNTVTTFRFPRAGFEMRFRNDRLREVTRLKR
jgi:hypothetical protein